MTLDQIKQKIKSDVEYFSGRGGDEYDKGAVSALTDVLDLLNNMDTEFSSPELLRLIFWYCRLDNMDNVLVDKDDILYDKLVAKELNQ